MCDCCVTVSMEGSNLCQEIVKRASSGFVYSEAVARYDSFPLPFFGDLVVTAISHPDSLAG